MMFKSRQHTQMTDQCLVEEIRGGCCVDNLSPLTDPFCTMTSWHRKPLHITGPLWGFSIFLTLCEGNLLLHYPTGGLENQNFDVSFILSSKKHTSWWWFWAPWRSCDITVMVSINNKNTSTVYWCIASKLKAPWNFYWMSNMFLRVEIFLFFVCYRVVPKRHSQLDYELNGL